MASKAKSVKGRSSSGKFKKGVHSGKVGNTNAKGGRKGFKGFGK